MEVDCEELKNNKYNDQQSIYVGNSSDRVEVSSSVFVKEKKSEDSQTRFARMVSQSHAFHIRFN